MSGGRGWAYVGAVLGAAVSVAANVAHTFVPPPAAGMAWRPPAGAVIGAVWWPVALLVAVEILARVDWPDRTRWVVIRWGGLVPVATVAAVVSYRHMAGLMASWGTEDWITASLGPLAVDGVMVMATAALLATRPVLDPDPTVAVEDPTLARLLQAIREGLLPERPTGEAIRRHLGVGSARARALRDLIRQPSSTGPVEETT
jgi:hypothetical protein